MKRTTIITFLAFSATLLNAENRSFDEAQAIARQFLTENAARPIEISSMRRAARNGAVAEAAMQPFYAFNDTRNDAFVIVSGSTLTRPVLAYGEGQIPYDVNDDMPEGLRWWLNAISEHTAYLESHPEEAETSAQINATTEAVAPILGGIEWDQNNPYNLQTPIISGTHCPTGCVATAIGQIIRYYRQPTVGKGSNSYTFQYTENGTTRSKTLSVNFAEQTYDYSLMPLTFYRYQGTDAEQQEVAKLLYHCGVAVNMYYGADGSGTTSPFIDRAFIENFSYNSRTTCVTRKGYTYEEWVSLMQGELRAGRPVIYTGNSYINKDSGHAFILEGFDQDGLYYVNWGWNGSYNAYYDIAVLNPHGYGSGATMLDDGFCESQDAVINISPSEGVGTYHTAISGGDGCTFTSNKSTANKGSSVTLTVRSIFNFSGIKADGNCGIVIMQQNNIISRKSIKSITLDGVSSDGAVSGLTLQASYAIPSDLADGSYQVYLYFQPKNSDDWDIIRLPRTTYESYLQFDVSGNSVSIARPKVKRDIHVTDWSFYDQPVATRTEKITALVTNQGEETLAGHFYLQLTSSSNTRTDKVEDANDCLILAPGESATVSFTYRFTEAGEWTSTLFFRPWNMDATASAVEGSKRTFDVEIDSQAGATFILHDASITSKSEDGKIYRNSPITASFNVTNTGYDYEGTFAIWLYAKSTNPTSLTPVAKYEGPVSVAGDSKAHDVSIDFVLDLSSLTKNVSYYARPYYYNGNSWELLDPNIYTKMNIYGSDDPASGIVEVVVDEPKNGYSEAQVFNVLGKRVFVPASGQLPKGIYIIDGRKVVIK